MSKLLVLCVLFFTASVAMAQQPGAAPPNPVASAQELIDKGQLKEAITQLDTLAAQRPEPPAVERLRGIAFYQQGQLSEAADAFQKAVAQDANDRQAMEMEGVALFRIGKPAEAAPLLEKARLSVASANIDSNYVLGLCYLETHRYDDARAAFAAQYGFPPDSPSAYLLAARMMLRREYLPIAETFAEKALTLNPSLPMAHLLLGEIRLAQSQLPQAIAEFEKERTLNPLYGETYNRLGDAYQRQGDYVQAQRALDRAVLLEPNSSGPFILLGKVMLKQQNPVMAKMYLDRAIKMDPGNYMAHALLGQSYRSLGENSLAAQEFQTVERIQSSTAPKLEQPK